MTPVDRTNQEMAIRILTEAFQDDPVINWCGNHPPSVRPFFDITVPSYITHGLTYLDPGNRGAAAWLGPGQKLAFSYTLENVWTVVKMGGLRGVYRMIRGGIVTEREHPRQPHYYLFAIGVTPDSKGKGIGTALISNILRRCDEEAMPAYLENSKPENLPFYEGHGFKVLKKIRFARSAPPLWLMWRDPIAADK